MKNIIDLNQKEIEITCGGENMYKEPDYVQFVTAYGGNVVAGSAGAIITIIAVGAAYFLKPNLF